MFLRDGILEATDKKLNMILSGKPGVGKTTLAKTAEAPVLVAFDDGHARANVTSGVPTLQVENYEEVLAFFGSDSKELNNFSTVIFDAGGQMVDCLKEHTVRVDKECQKDGRTISLRGYGVVSRKYLDLSEIVRKKFDCINIFHTITSKDNDGHEHYDLMCEGKTSQTVWIPADLGAYYAIESTGRTLHFAPNPYFSTKQSFGVQKMYNIPDFTGQVQADTLKKIFAQCKANINASASKMSEIKALYTEAMENGKALLETVVDEVSASEIHLQLLNLPEISTSKREIQNIFKEKVTEMGLVWNPEVKKWEYKDTE